MSKMLAFQKGVRKTQHLAEKQTLAKYTKISKQNSKTTTFVASKQKAKVSARSRVPTSFIVKDHLSIAK